MRIKTIADFRSAMRAGAYAWPGGYPQFFITADCASLSFEAARQERRQILEAIRDNANGSGWRIVACEVNWEDDSLHCEHTGARIPSAYGEE